MCQLLALPRSESMGRTFAPCDFTVGWAVVGVPSRWANSYCESLSRWSCPAKEDHLVFEKCLPDEGNRRRVELPAESDSVDSGADMRAEGGDSAASGVNGRSVR